MNDAYEMYDYGDLFPTVSSSSIRMKEESKNNTNEKYLKELKRRADEATRNNFTDKLSDRIKELNEVLNTKALEEMIQLIENRPIKLKGPNFANMEKTSKTMNASLDKDFDVQSVNLDGLKSNVSDAFASYGTQDSSIGEVSSVTEPEPLPAVIPDDMSKGSSYFNSAGDLVTNGEVVSGTKPEPLPAVIPDDMSKGSSYFNSAGDLVTNGEVVSGTESKTLPTVIPDDMSKGSSYLKSAEDLVTNGEVSSGTEPEPLPAVIPDDMSKGSSYLKSAEDLVTNGEVVSGTEPEPLPAVIPDDMSKGSSYLKSAEDLVTNGEVVSGTESKTLPTVIPDDMSKGSSYLNSAEDLVTNGEVASGTEPEPLPAVIPDDMSKGSSYLKSAEDLVTNGEVASGTEPESLPTVIPDDMSKGSSYLNPAEDLSTNAEAVSSTEPESLPVNDEVVRAIDDYVDGHIGTREDTSSSDMSSDVDPIQIEATEFEPSNIDDNGEVYLSDGQLEEKIANYIGAKLTEDGNYTFPVATVPDKTPKDVIRGEDVQVVPEREDTSVSAEIGYADNNVDSQIDGSFAEETSGDVSDSLDAVSSTDNIFGDDQNEDTPVYESSDMSSTGEGENESERIDSSPAIDPFFGELVGYNNSDGGLNFSSLVPDLIRQHDETARIGLELDDTIGEQARKISELELQEAMQAQTTRELAGRLYNLTALEASKNAEKQETIEGNNKELELMMKTIRDNASTIATLRQMLGESTDVNEDSDVKGRSK